MNPIFQINAAIWFGFAVLVPGTKTPTNDTSSGFIVYPNIKNGHTLNISTSNEIVVSVQELINIDTGKCLCDFITVFIRDFTDISRT